jgi:hypothetical protein
MHGLNKHPGKMGSAGVNWAMVANQLSIIFGELETFS